jgi:hypothetical protein
MGRALFPEGWASIRQPWALCPRRSKEEWHRVRSCFGLNGLVHFGALLLFAANVAGIAGASPDEDEDERLFR